ncbi:MAG: glycosyltransferase family 4 protein [Candidatus Omnitrophica bacterium]|nr:glycosyltransferase family 4 protein [Candidatus Omnitrophota bacterium]
MKVALVAFWYIEYTIELANALADLEGTEIVLFVPERLACKYSSQISSLLKLKTFKYRRMSNPINFFVISGVFLKLNKLKPSIIHVQGGNVWFNFLLPLLNKQSKLIVTIHDVTPHEGDKMTSILPLRERIIRFADGFIVHGNKIKDEFIRKYKADLKKVAVIPHGEFSIFSRIDNQLIEEEEATVLFFGRILEYKGLQYLIKAEPLIKKEIPNIKICIAGEGELLKEYEKLIVNRTSFEIINSYIDNNKVSQLFQKCCLVVLPYIEASQSGIVPIAYAFKKPVIATSVGSLPEVVKDGVTGFIISPRDINSLAEKVIFLIKNKEKRLLMGKNSFHMTKNELSWIEVATKTLNFYKEIGIIKR